MKNYQSSTALTNLKGCEEVLLVAAKDFLLVANQMGLRQPHLRVIENLRAASLKALLFNSFSIQSL